MYIDAFGLLKGGEQIVRLGQLYEGGGGGLSDTRSTVVSLMVTEQPQRFNSSNTGCFRLF